VQIQFNSGVLDGRAAPADAKGDHRRLHLKGRKAFVSQPPGGGPRDSTEDSFPVSDPPSSW
jgi:hypothetical protein